MFVYTVYGVTGIPGRATSRRVERVTPVAATSPIDRSRAMQRAREDRPFVRVAVPVAGRDGKPEDSSSYEAMFRRSLQPNEEPKTSTSINYLENAQSLVLAYRQPKTGEGLDFASRQSELEQLRQENQEIQDPNTLTWMV